MVIFIIMAAVLIIPSLSLVYMMGSFSPQCLTLLVPFEIISFTSVANLFLSSLVTRTLLAIYHRCAELSLPAMLYVYISINLKRVFCIITSLLSLMIIDDHKNKKNLLETKSFIVIDLIKIFITSLKNMFFQPPSLSSYCMGIVNRLQDLDCRVSVLG